MKDILLKIKKRYQLGGISYLIYNIIGFPIRYISNNIDSKKKKKLLKEVIERQIPDQLKLPLADDQKVIVSLATYPPRFNVLPLCLKSLLLQSVLPNKIIVYLGNDACIDDITEEVKLFEKFGVEFRYDSEKDLRGHKKYFYAMQEYPDDIIITVDDDMVYSFDLIERLLEAHDKYKEAVCAFRVHKIGFNFKGKIKPYETWKKNIKTVHQPSMRLLPTGNGGVLYPPKALYKEAFFADRIMGLCLGADDIWLKCMEVLNGTKVFYVPSAIAYAEIQDSQNITLSKENIGMARGNDIYLNNVLNYYGIGKSDFVDI